MNNKEKNIIISILVSICLLSVCYFNLKKDDITLVVKDKASKISSFKSTVKDLLDENNIKYDDDDKIMPNLESKLKNGMQIEVIDVKNVAKTEYEDIDFEVEVLEDKNLEKGKTQVEVEGIKGQKEISYNIIYHNDEIIEKKVVKENISKEPIKKIVKKGIKEDIVASRGSNSRLINVEATAYAGDGITATGTKPKWGTIAVDPKVIPYGSKVYIPRFNMTFIAEDCGGAIKGNMIDIFMGSEREAYSWGRRRIDIYVTN